MEEKVERRGGRREGSGRKPGKEAKLITLKLEVDLLNSMASIPNRNRYINEAVRARLKADGLLTD